MHLVALCLPKVETSRNWLPVKIYDVDRDSKNRPIATGTVPGPTRSIIAGVLVYL